MPNYILTGTPGAGKTTLLRQLERDGYPVVEEAATDVIYLEQAQGQQTPWQSAGFIETITRLQILRQQFYCHGDGIRFFDRSPFCTAALAIYLGYAIPALLQDELASLKRQQFFANKVLFISNLGFIQHSEARKISFAESLRFEDIHRNVYQQHGFSLVNIPKDTLLARVNHILRGIV